MKVLPVKINALADLKIVKLEIEALARAQALAAAELARTSARIAAGYSGRS